MGNWNSIKILRNSFQATNNFDFENSLSDHTIKILTGRLFLFIIVIHTNQWGQIFLQATTHSVQQNHIPKYDFTLMMGQWSFNDTVSHFH